MKRLVTAALAASMALASNPAVAQSERGEERRAVFAEADFCAVVLDPSPFGGFFLAFGDEFKLVHTSGGSTNVQCRAQALGFVSLPTEKVTVDAMCGYFDEGTGQEWLGDARVTVSPDGSATSKCNLNKKDSIGFVEFPPSE